MDLAAARLVMGAESNSSMEDIEALYQSEKQHLLDKLVQAPSEGLKAKFRAALSELEEARETLLSAANAAASTFTSSTRPSVSSLSATKYADLPAAGPILTQVGGTGSGPAASSLGLKEGDVLMERYEFRERVGVGGMGAVFRAFDRNRNEEIAIKVLLPGLLSNAQARERFLHEAKLASSLSHPNIVNVFDVQKDGAFDFLTMELLHGQTLRQMVTARRLSRQGFTVSEVQDIVSPLCDALGYAHSKTVHRDIKPENVWVGDDGTIKVMDFGIARLLSTSQLTQTGVAMGTAYYMAPEQLAGRPVDARADQYSLAVMVYELLAGEIPAGRIKPLHEVAKGVSKGLSRAVERALEPDASARYTDMAAFKLALKKGERRRGAGGTKIVMGVLGLAVAAAIAGAFVMRGEAVNGMLEQFKPVSKEERERQQVSALRLVGEVKNQRDRFAAIQKVFEQRARDAEQDVDRLTAEVRRARDEQDRRRGESDLKQAEEQRLLRDQEWKLAQQVVFSGDATARFEGDWTLADNLVRDKDYIRAATTLEALKAAYDMSLNKIDDVSKIVAKERAAKVALQNWSRDVANLNISRPQYYAPVEEAFNTAEAKYAAGTYVEAATEFDAITVSIKQLDQDVANPIRAKLDRAEKDRLAKAAADAKEREDRLAQERVIKSYWAMAVASELGKNSKHSFGFSINEAPEQAKLDALSKCNSTASETCRIVGEAVPGKLTCFAAVQPAGNDQSYRAIAKSDVSTTEAGQSAMDLCARDKRTGCHIVFSKCNNEH